MECESKSDTGNNRGDWNHVKISQKMPEQQTGRARNKGTIDNSHIWHVTHTAQNSDVKLQNVFHGRNNITCGINCTYRRAVTRYALETWFVQCMQL